ncbi:LEAF RUST 10 DISEASE-RESISTANCE LOCUS RECEPTOR-LIKE PROTEIN KINASE-like 1.2 [Triticum urartu]|uniref:LEAF RUST 10 DISEASE-RESISTANCE LOCUS RECEPTOR-LIKE PROTEIN KINASE-like 1.2 n=1 Tax=Triticum urartu TaxID=4572 RepID=UPI00204423EE|nr:LEAF RUST 10 DISEASE-RESISTANCE LOCUS RECEPTOR-LIKE PROTEIN KINASE-like 1.2 [Triticum urartu]
MLLLTLLSSTTTDASFSFCEPAACGGLQVACPFWLGSTHPPECGYRAFRVTCDDTRKAFLKNSFWNYQILDISYKDCSFRVSNIELYDGTCNVELRLGLTPFGISTANQELFFLYNCTALHTQPPLPTWARMNCMDGSRVPTFHSFPWLAGGYKPDDKWSPVMMPVLGYEDATGADYNRLMKGGFLLNYTLGDCTACEGSGGLCWVNTTCNIFKCHCSDSDRVSPSTICSELHTYISDSELDLCKRGASLSLTYGKIMRFCFLPGLLCCLS